MAIESTKPLAVVTGASSGIGLELAKQFADHGFDLLIASEGPGLMIAKQQLEQGSAKVQAVQVDLASYEGVEKLYSEIKATGRPVEAIAINAGVGVGGAFSQDTDLQAELNMIALNVTSTVHLAKRVIPDMVAAGKGRVLFTASIASTAPTPFIAVYGATKAFVLSFAEAIRSELKETGVTVTALMPGPTDTNFFHRADMDDTKVAVSEKDNPADVARDGFDAMMAGKDKVFAHSAKVKMQGSLNEILPETIKADMQGKETKPGSATH